MTKIDVSVIVPSLNAANHLADCLESIVSQDGVRVETIVVDDGSSDNSAEIAESIPNVRVIRQFRQGACVARNRGLAESSGDFIKFLDADDYLLPGVLSRQVMKSLELNFHSVTYGNFIRQSEKGQKEIKTRLLRKSQLNSIILQNLMTSTPLHRRHLLEKVGGFDEKLLSAQEWNLHIRLSAAGVMFEYDDSPIYVYRDFEDPERISQSMNSDLKKKYAYKIKVVDITADRLIEPVYSRSDGSNVAFARYLWNAGRWAYRAGSVEAASELFEHSLLYCPKTSCFLPFYYRCMLAYLGRNYSEQILSPNTLGRIGSRIERGVWSRL